MSWVDFSAADRDRMRRVIALFNEPGAVDELGLGVLRDALSGALFPGTSTLHTRLRYVLFIPWIYRDLEARQMAPSELVERARDAELGLIEPLTQSGVDSEDDESVWGVIGRRARTRLKRLPSSVYWTALVQWGIFVPRLSQAQFHQAFGALTRRRSDRLSPDDPGRRWSRARIWHERLPPAPDRFPRDVSFALTRAEAEYVQSRILATCGNTLLGWLAAPAGAHALLDSDWAWELDLTGAPMAVIKTVGLARRFALVMHGSQLLYNLMLAEERQRALAGEDASEAEQWQAEYRAKLADWTAELDGESGWGADALLDHLWRFSAEASVAVRRGGEEFVTAWTRCVFDSGPAAVFDDAGARELVRLRERKLKGRRSRFDNPTRLREWTGAAGAHRLGYRWRQTRVLLRDLRDGLARERAD